MSARRHPRTTNGADGAFRDARYASAIERSTRTPAHEWALYIVGVIAVLVLLFVAD